MGTFTQWDGSKKVASVNWVFGPEQALKNCVMDYMRSSVAASELDRQFFDATTDSSSTIWDTIHHYSLNDDAPRLLEVVHAEKLDTVKLDLWLTDYVKTNAKTVLLLVSDVEPTSLKIKAPKALIVKCVMPKMEDRLQWISRVGSLSEFSAKRLLEYKNGDLQASYDVCRKIKAALPDASTIDLSLEMLQALDEETPSDFVDAVLCQDKSRAFVSAASVPKDEIRKVLSSLDYHLSLLDKLKTVLESLPKGSKMTLIPGFPMARIGELSPLARKYSVIKLTSCRQLIVFLESYVRSGVTDGILEALVTLW